MARGKLLVACLVWLLVVAGASFVTWNVIDAAGRDVITATADEPGASPRSAPSTAAPTADRTMVRGAPRARVGTWQGVAGSVVVRCRGPVAALDAATPADGWRVEVSDRGPERVEVELRREDPDGRARVRAECVGGQPRFAVDTHADSGSDDGAGVGSVTSTDTPSSPSVPSSAPSSPTDDSGGGSGSGGGSDDRGREDGGRDRGSDDG